MAFVSSETSGTDTTPETPVPFASEKSSANPVFKIVERPGHGLTRYFSIVVGDVVRAYFMATCNNAARPTNIHFHATGTNECVDMQPPFRGAVESVDVVMQCAEEFARRLLQKI